MITIDLIDEQISRSEKPDIHRKLSVPGIGTGVADSLYLLAQNHQRELLQEAHIARLLKTGEGPAIDLQRFVSDVKSTVFTLAERYTQRNR